MNVVAILCKRGTAGTPDILNGLIRYLDGKIKTLRIAEGVCCGEGQAEVVPEEKLGDGADLLIVLGGDGTLLHAVKLLRGRDAPILGVNLGRLGFLTEIQLSELYPTLDKILAGECPTQIRRMLHATLTREGKEILSQDVLNDVVINNGALARILRLHVGTAQGFMTSYRGDGLIISTPTGSTAYNMAAGGPVLYPTLATFALTPICPHTFANRPVVLPDDEEVIVELTEATSDVHLSLDGQAGAVMRQGDIVRVRRATTTARLVRSPTRGYFDILREKLGWGQD
ncbi:MAG: NAD(+) kinase [Myxococcales bacterium]|nr:MAG: NAD(+) kinase [Myxococcales bacterium]